MSKHNNNSNINIRIHDDTHSLATSWFGHRYYRIPTKNDDVGDNGDDDHDHLHDNNLKPQQETIHFHNEITSDDRPVDFDFIQPPYRTKRRSMYNGTTTTTPTTTSADFSSRTLSLSRSNSGTSSTTTPTTASSCYRQKQQQQRLLRRLDSSRIILRKVIEFHFLLHHFVLFFSLQFIMFTSVKASLLHFTDLECTRGMALSDLDRDDAISTTEYIRFIQNLIPSTTSISATEYTTLPLVYQEAYTQLSSTSTKTGMIDIAGSKPGQVPTTEQSTHLVNICAVLDTTIQSALDAPPTSSSTVAPSVPTASTEQEDLGTSTTTPIDTTNGSDPGNIPTLPFDTCTRDLTLADLSRDDKINSMEYVRFLSRNVPTIGLTDEFTSLSGTIQQNFITLATGSSETTSTDVTTLVWDITGSKPNQTPTSEQNQILETICQATAIAIANSNSDVTTIPPNTTTTTTNSEEEESSTTNTTTTENVPPTDSTVPLIPLETCQRDLTLADLSRDDLLDSKEYVRFISRNDPDVTVSMLFTDLSSAVQENFLKATTTTTTTTGTVDGSIDITGSKPTQTPTPEQLSALEQFCQATSYAIAAQDSGTPTDSNTTTSGNTTTATTTGGVTIYNSFVVSNTIRLTAGDYLVSGNTYRQLLVKAYQSFVGLVVSNNITTTTDPSTNTTDSANRYLKVQNTTRKSKNGGGDNSIFVMSDLLHEESIRYLQENNNLQVLDGSVAILDVIDSICPPTAIGGNVLCVTMFTSFIVDDVNNEITDPTTVLTDLTTRTQSAMTTPSGGSTNNLFQLQLLELDPTVNLQIETSSEPVRSPRENSGDTSSNPNATRTGGTGGGMSAGIVVVIVIVSLLVLGGAWYWNKNKRPTFGKPRTCFDSIKELIQSKRKNPTQKRANHSSTDDGSQNQTNDGRGPDGRDNAGTKMMAGLGSLFGSNQGNANGGDGNNLFQDPEQALSSHRDEEKGNGKGTGNGAGEQTGGGGGGVFGVFHPGKKKNNGGKDGQDVFGDAFENHEDFANYAFDDPAELQGNKNNNNNKNKFGASTGDDPFTTTAYPLWNVDQSDGDNGWNGGALGWETDVKTNDFVNDENVSEPGSEDYEDDDDTCSEPDVAPAPAKSQSGEQVTNVKRLGVLVDNGEWEGVATTFENRLQENDESEGSEDRSQSTDGDDKSASVKDDNSVALAIDPFQDSNLNNQSADMSTDEKEQYRQEVEEMVRKACPDEINNVSAMMEQFAGREPELINTLQTLYERSKSQRALKAVHKSKAIPERENRVFATGGAESSAVIAAASMLNSDATRSTTDSGDVGTSTGSGNNSSGSYYSNEDDGSGSYTGSHSRSGSYSGSRTQSRRSDEQSYDDDEEEGSASQSYIEDEPSHTASKSNFDGESYTGSGSRSQEEGSYMDDEQSHSHSGSGSGSYNSQPVDEDQSYHSGGSQRSASQSYVSGAGSKSVYSKDMSGGSGSESEGSGSYRSGSRSHSGSYSGSGSYK